MIRRYSCYIEFSASGKLARIVHKNRQTMMTLRVLAPSAASICADIHKYYGIGAAPKGFEGVLLDLESYEKIDTVKEEIVAKS